MSDTESSSSADIPSTPTSGYRGRLAPSPTGWLHAGHACTFWTAYEHCRAAGGRLVLRSEDLDASRVRPEFAQGMLEDLRWLGIRWDEGPDVGGASGPYVQSQRENRHRAALESLRRDGWLYPCRCTRKDIQTAVAAPHAGDDEPLYPGICRGLRLDDLDASTHVWRFRVPEGETISFLDGAMGPQQFVAGREFGDFVVWRKDDHPAYQLAVVVDDAEMGITEVVRGADLLLSTARQILLYRALHLMPPAFHHCPLLNDSQGRRLAKRHDALAIRSLRTAGKPPEEVRDFNGMKDYLMAQAGDGTVE